MDIEQLYNEYQLTRNPKTLSRLMTELNPLVSAEISRYQGPRPLLESKAKQLILRSINTYKPAAGARLSTWVIGNMRELTRYGRHMQQGVRMPEMMYRQFAELESVRNRMLEETGMEPTDDELTDEIGISPRRIKKIRETVVPVISEGAMADIDPNMAYGAAAIPAEAQQMGAANDLVYNSLDERDRQIYDWKLKENIKNKEIAKRLGVSEPFVTQRSGDIAKRILDSSQHV